MYEFKLLPFHEYRDELFSGFPDRTIGQTLPWLRFIEETQKADPIIIEISENNARIGYFFGALVRRFGVKVLGSPLTGWTTPYMGFNLHEGADRVKILQHLSRFLFRQLGVIYLEVWDRAIDEDMAKASGMTYRVVGGYEVALSGTEQEIFAAMSWHCRRDIRKAEKSSIEIEEVDDPAKFAEVYIDQLEVVFRRQGRMPSYDKVRVESLIRKLHPSGSLLLLLAKNSAGKYIASGVFPAHFDRMFFWGNASLHEYTSVRPNELLHWHAIRYWKARGIRYYDMQGGGDYKKKYGGSPIAVPWFYIPRYEFLMRVRSWVFSLSRMTLRMKARARSAIAD